MSRNNKKDRIREPHRISAAAQPQVFIPVDKVWKHEGKMVHIYDVPSFNLVEGSKALYEALYVSKSKEKYFMQQLANAADELERRGEQEVYCPEHHQTQVSINDVEAMMKMLPRDVATRLLQKFLKESEGVAS
jgi:hypothetical protein